MRDSIRTVLVKFNRNLRDVTAPPHPFWAHSPDPAKGVLPQLLPDHLRSVAELAAEFGRDFNVPGLDKVLRASGLLHDAGKYKLEFQRKRLGYDPVTGRAGLTRSHGVDHSSLGASVVYVPEMDNPNAFMKLRNLLARAIAAHHAGLPNAPEFRARMEDSRRDRNRAEPLSIAVADVPELRELMKSLESISLDMTMKNVDVLTRMVLSCLVDADRTDSEAHANAFQHAVRQRHMASLDELGRRLQTRRAGFSTTGPINELRHQMYTQAIQAVDLAPGFFRLTMPTGGGKTLTSLEFALKHAVRYGLQRVIYAIPYTSIIDQTAKVFRDNLNQGNEENVLEHHSAVEPAVEDPNETSLWRILLSESWDAPLIVTTTVQLFESLFANKAGRLRKLHNIAGSVIVLDEVQALPTTLLGPILDVLSELVKNYRVSVVFCTATQPAFNAAAGFDFPGLDEARDLVPNAQAYFAKLQRVEYDIDVARTTPWSEVADRMLASERVLTIVNLRRDAHDLYKMLQAHDSNALHLSTNMYPAHRKKAMELIRGRLKREEPCRVVSTQLIECGVDVDFPSVYRAIGPLDSIVQAAGRCNREGRLTDGSGHEVKGHVWVFKPEGTVAPRGDYLVKVIEASEMLTDEADLHSAETFERYFQRVFKHTDSTNLALQSARERQMFSTVAEMFKFIDSDTVPVVITSQIGPDGRVDLDRPRELLSQLESAHAPLTTNVWHELQMYSVGLFRTMVPRLSQYLRLILVGGKEELELYEWLGRYDDQLGLVMEGDVERYVI